MKESPIGSKVVIFKKPFTTLMILLSVEYDTMLYLQYEDCLNGML